ncbi:hypothetical protein EPUS_07312 [Endocarpon pusillum Z07020]|uniref:Major facilitator superfamily (MFS) profile domain-containing protein n=1 Tax=Endocarpon pusillum (strain Z07020 / HMAS-L-300199) TaxID=1263415 RepID=U1GFK9_ENDPU|nr:uncharacterized protein EPUS_07312 [Endocarpon pusillum Z07020]ERF76432.1 hypothetical protein EPUS_07312 [Endocarpon pusillum Z07020]
MSTTQTPTYTSTDVAAEPKEAAQHSTMALSDVSNEPKVQGKQLSSEAEQQLPKGLNLAVIMLSLYATMFLVALDRMIIATAVPRITEQFDSLDDIS